MTPGTRVQHRDHGTGTVQRVEAYGNLTVAWDAQETIGAPRIVHASEVRPAWPDNPTEAG